MTFREEFMSLPVSPELVRMSWALHTSPGEIVDHYEALGITARIAAADLHLAVGHAVIRPWHYL